MAVSYEVFLLLLHGEKFNFLLYKNTDSCEKSVLYPEIISQIQKHLKVQYAIQQQAAQKVKC